MATALNICDNGIPFVTMVRETEPSKRTNAPAFPRPLFKGRRSAMAFVLGTGLHDYKEISKSLCLTCVAFSDQCGGTTDAKGGSVRRVFLSAADRAIKDSVEIRQSERL